MKNKPLFLMRDAPFFNLLWPGELYVWGYGKVIEYSPDRIILSSRHTSVTICGGGLRVSAMNADELVIRGDIAALSFPPEASR